MTWVITDGLIIALGNRPFSFFKFKLLIDGADWWGVANVVTVDVATSSVALFPVAVVVVVVVVAVVIVAVDMVVVDDVSTNSVEFSFFPV